MSEPQTTLRIDSLALENFRCFANCSINFHPELTVLVAENGHGKTALLDATGLALDAFVAPMVSGRNGGGFAITDIRQEYVDKTMLPKFPTSFSAVGYCGGALLEWSRSIGAARNQVRTSYKAARKLKEAALHLRDTADAAKSSSAPPVTLPLVALYGTARPQILATTRLRSWPFRQDLGRRVAYLDCLNSNGSFPAFTKWFEKRWTLAGSSVGKYVAADEQPHVELAAVRAAITTALAPTGWRNFTWQAGEAGNLWKRQGCLAGEHPEAGVVPLKSLSDGVRNMMAMVADVAHRCMRLNPHFGEDAARKTPGVLIIDEVDLHLHPRWQQLVIRSLRKAFPNVQLIVSTHSPHVLSTVDCESIRVIHLYEGQGVTPMPETQTLGDASAGVLARTMNVDPIPDVEPAERLSRYRGLVQQGEDESPQAMEIWTKLVDHFGADHPLIQETGVLRRLQEFKREHHVDS